MRFQRSLPLFVVGLLAPYGFGQVLPRVQVDLTPARASWETAAALASGVGRVSKRVSSSVFEIEITSRRPAKMVMDSLRSRKSVLTAKSVEPVLDAGPMLGGSLRRLEAAVESLERSWEWHCTAAGLDPKSEAPGLDYLEAYLQRMQERSYPADIVNYRGMMHLAEERAKTMGGQQIAVGPQWQYLGPRNLDIPYRTYYGLRPINGRVNALAYDPIQAGVYYAGSAKGGVWKTTDAGVNWSPLTDHWPLLGVSSLAVDPTNRLTVLAGTGDYDGGDSIGFGVMRSLDGGATWTQTGAAAMGGSCVSDLAFNPDNPNIVIATTGHGSGSGRVFRSVDGGQNWTVSLNVAGDWHGVDVSVSNAGVRTFWVVGSGGSRVYKSSDNGANWTAVTVPSLGTAVTDVACSKVTAGVTYVLDCGAQRLRKTIDTGTNWTDTTNNFANQWGQSWYDWHIHTSRLNTTDVVYVGLIDIAMSKDGGATWRNMGGSNWTPTYSGTAITHNDQHSFAVNPLNPNEVLVGNDGGVYRSTYNSANDTITWNILNKFLGITQFYTLAMHPTNPDYILGGTQDNASAHSFGDLNNWGNPGAGDGAGCLINPNLPANQYHSWYNQNIERTENSFGSTTNITPNWSGHSTPFIGKLWFDPNNPDLVYANTNYLNRYNRATNSWSLQLGAQNFGGVIQSFDAAKSDSTRLYVGRSGQVWMSVNNGGNWARIDRQGLTNGLPNRSIMAISVDPSNKNDVVVVLGSTGTAKVWRCQDTSATTPFWAPLTTGLPDIHHICFARDPARPQTHWYVGNDGGVWRTTNGGASWTDYATTTGLPYVEFDALVAVAATGYLNAASYGRGVWRVPLSTTETLAPTVQEVNLGKITAGNLASLAADDNNAETLCKFLVPNLSSPFISVRLTYATTVLAPSSMQFRVKARFISAGSYVIRLLQNDYTNNVEVQTLPDTSLSGTFTVFTGTATGTLSNFVEQATGQTRARFTIRQTGPAAVVLPCTEIEYAQQVVSG